MARQVVLLSGGIDSLVCAELARQASSELEELAGCVFVDYGHPAQVPEGWKAFAYCGEHRVPLKVVHAFGLDLGDMASEAGARVVPSRNAILLALAANAARGLGGQRLVIGATSEDQRDYPDCRPAFITAMMTALNMSIAAPLLGMSKAMVIDQARRLGLTRGDAWSCYGPGPVECRECPSCQQAMKAWG